jgi:hypothetical protein
MFGRLDLLSVDADVSLSNFKTFCIREQLHPKYEELLYCIFLIRALRKRNFVTNFSKLLNLLV